MIKIYDWKATSAEDQNRILRRAQADLDSVRDKVVGIVRAVRDRGDEALVELTRKFDDPGFTEGRLRVTPAELSAAYRTISPKVLAAIREQIRLSRAYAEKQRSVIAMEWEIETVPGVVTGTRVTPVDSAGLYVPAGKAPLPTVAQILTVAAKTAGVPRIVVCFPPTGDYPEILVAAAEAGADEIYRVGGAQAIAALAYGTATIAPVDFIAGPGSSYVQAAKLQVFGQVGVDMLSGPSEALILADADANPVYLAADILARCEHGSDSAGVLVTDSPVLARRTIKEIERQLPALSRQSYLRAALDRFSAIVVVENSDQMIEFSNLYGPEHLEVQVKNPRALLPLLRNAGSIFLGEYAPVAVGDYASGTNHCLPTGAAARFASPVNVSMFMKASGYQFLTREGLRRLQPIVETLSDVEGLDAHKRSVQIRLEPF